MEETRALAAVAFDDQDAGSGPVHASPNLGPMSAAIHNISARHLHDISIGLPDDRQFLRSWRRSIQDCLNQQNSRIVQFLLTDASGDVTSTVLARRCTDVLTKYSKPSWSFTSSTRDLSLPTATADASAWVAQEIGITPAGLRDHMRKAIRLYANTAAALSAAEQRLEEKLKRLETIVSRMNDMMFLEPTAELEQMAEPARIYLDSVLEKVTIEAEYKDLAEQYKRFSLLKSVVSLSSFQKTGAPPICCICMTKEISQAVTPCGHTFCDDCCVKQLTSCYMCRVQIRDKVRLYFG